jgi:hypothetical protein
MIGRSYLADSTANSYVGSTKSIAKGISILDQTVFYLKTPVRITSLIQSAILRLCPLAGDSGPTVASVTMRD